MTGWGQDGPLAPRAGHDINYIALAGVLHAIGREGRGAGAAAQPRRRLRRRRHAARLRRRLRAARGAAHRARARWSTRRWSTARRCSPRCSRACSPTGRWTEERGANVARHRRALVRRATRRSDGKFVAIGAIEAKFYAELLDRLGLAGRRLPAQHDRAGWPELRAALRRGVPREDARRVGAGVRGLGRLLRAGAHASPRRGAHPHNVARGGYVAVGGVEQPAPAPRFSRTPGAVERARRPSAARCGREALGGLGIHARRDRSARRARARVRTIGPRVPAAGGSLSAPPQRITSSLPDEPRGAGTVTRRLHNGQTAETTRA